MSLGGLIPISGGSSGTKKDNGASNLTSGLISIGGAKGSGGGVMDDLDMSDFDVDDLLADNVSSSATSKSKFASPSKGSSKKSSKSKGKDSSGSSSKKKSKSKTKDSTLSAFDDSVDNMDDSTDDWRSNKPKVRASKWGDDSSELASSPLPAKKKSGALDAEFAKMLGLDDDDGDAVGSFDASAASADDDNSNSRGNTGGVRAFSSRVDDDTASDLSSFTYEPRVRGGNRGKTNADHEKPLDSGANSTGAFAVADSSAKRAYNDPFASRTSSTRLARGSDSKRDDRNDHNGDGSGQRSAPFFQSEPRGNNDDDPFGTRSSLSFLSSSSATTDRRGGRSGRRGSAATAPAIDDPFASTASGRGASSSSPSDAPSVKPSTFDSLFSRSSNKYEPATSENDSDWVPATATVAIGGRRGGGSRQQQQQQSATASDDLLAELFPSEQPKPPVVAVAAPPTTTSASSAKDDLLAELFPSSRSVEPVQQQPERRSAEFSTRAGTTAPSGAVIGSAKDDLLAELLPSEPQTRKPLGRRTAGAILVSDTDGSELKQQDDLLAELFPSTASSLTSKREPEATTASHEDNDDDDDDDDDDRSSNATRTRDTHASVDVRGTEASSIKRASTATAGGLADISSARDSLLLDLLPASPPKTKPASVEQRQRPRVAQTPSPVKDAASTTTLSVRLQQQQPVSPQRSPQRLDDSTSPTRRTNSSFVSVSALEPVTAAAIATSSSNDPLASPGRTKTLASPSKSSINEIDFEQSKDSLLEELLVTSSPPPPKSPPAKHRLSYSQSFDTSGDGGGGATAATATAVTAGAPSMLRALPLDNEVRDNRRVTTTAIDKHPPAAREFSSNSSNRQSVPPESIRTVIGTAMDDEDIDQRAQALAAAAVQQREQALRLESDAVVAALTARHAHEVTSHTQTIQTLTQQLQEERTQHAALDAQRTQLAAAAAAASHERMLVQQQLRALELDKLASDRAFHALQAQHATCATQQALLESERAGFKAQAQALETQQRDLVLQLSAAKQATQTVELAFARFQHDAQTNAALQTQRDAFGMRQLTDQLQASLVSLRVLQEQVVGDEQRQLEAANSSQVRMITALESSARQCAQTTEDECVRLASLLATLETTLRSARHTHADERERLRHEQLRLDELSAHVQAQTRVLSASADANTQLLAQCWQTSRGDVQVLEARLATRREALDTAERTLADDRAQFSTMQDAWRAQQTTETHALQRAQQHVEQRVAALQHERMDLDAVIASHEDAFAQLQRDARAVQDAREQLEDRAQHVCASAAALEALTHELVAREDAIAAAHAALEHERTAFTAVQQRVASDAQSLDARAQQLHVQQQQIESARRRLHDQRTQHVLAGRSIVRAATVPKPTATADAAGRIQPRAATRAVHNATQQLPTHFMHSSSSRASAEASPAPGDNNHMWRAPVPIATTTKTNRSDPLSWTTANNNDGEGYEDPTGLSPAFRKLVETHWREVSDQQTQPYSSASGGAASANGRGSSRRALAALHKERMWINCIGLDTTPPPSVRRTAAARDNNASTDDYSSKHLLQQHHQQQQQRRTTGPTTAYSATNKDSLRAPSAAVGVGSNTARIPPPPPPSWSQPLSVVGSRPAVSAPSKRIVTIDL